MRSAGVLLLITALAFAVGSGAAYFQLPSPKELTKDSSAAGAEVRLLETVPARSYRLGVDIELDPTYSGSTEPSTSP